jgi:hypothetical protein
MAPDSMQLHEITCITQDREEETPRRRPSMSNKTWLMSLLWQLAAVVMFLTAPLTEWLL